MSDIAISWDVPNSRGDWSLFGADLATDANLKTAIWISLFTDRLAAPDDEIPDGTYDRRGWWADDAARPIGSRLWLLDREKDLDAVLQRAYDYIAEALAWLIDDDVVARFDISVERVRRGFLGATITAYQSSGYALSATYEFAWKGIT